MPRRTMLSRSRTLVSNPEPEKKVGAQRSRYGYWALPAQLGGNLCSGPAPIAAPTRVVLPENALATVTAGPAGIFVVWPMRSCDVETNEFANLNSPTARPPVP